jgi:peroxiredoxin
MSRATSHCRRLPDLDLPSTDGFTFNLSIYKWNICYFLFSLYGNGCSKSARLGQHPWHPRVDTTSTSFFKALRGFQRLDIKVFGLSFQDTEWQFEFVKGTSLCARLLSVQRRLFSTRWGYLQSKLAREIICDALRSFRKTDSSLMCDTQSTFLKITL